VPFFCASRLIVAPGTTGILPVTFYSEAAREGAAATLTLRHNDGEERSALMGRGGGADPAELVDQTPYVYALSGEEGRRRRRRGATAPPPFTCPPFLLLSPPAQALLRSHSPRTRSSSARPCTAP